MTTELETVLTRVIADSYTRCVGPRGVAQSVARGVWDAEVGGSSPLTPTAGCKLIRRAGVTQLVEYLPSKQAVAGSSPVPRSTAMDPPTDAAEVNRASRWLNPYPFADVCANR